MDLTPNQQLLYNQLKLDEGEKTKPYKDTVGKITIGIGRNLTDVGLSEDEVMYLWRNDVLKVEDALDTHFSWWRQDDDIRQRVLIDLCFNMGIGTLLEFKDTMARWQTGDFATAAQGLKNSKWFTEVGERGPRLVNMLATGKDYTD